MADFHPLLDLYKDQVLKLAETLNLPEWVTARVPSAGLWPGQSDEGEMGVTYRDIGNTSRKGPGRFPPRLPGL